MFHLNSWFLLFYIYPVGSHILWNTVLDVNDITLVNYKVTKTQTINREAPDTIETENSLTKDPLQNRNNIIKEHFDDLQNKRGNALSNTDDASTNFKSVRRTHAPIGTQILTQSYLPKWAILKSKYVSGHNNRGIRKRQKGKFNVHWCCPFKFSRKSERNPLITGMSYEQSLMPIISHQKPLIYSELPVRSLLGKENLYLKDDEYLHKLDDPESQKVFDTEDESKNTQDNNIKQIDSPISFTAASNGKETIPEDIVLLGGRHDGSQKWWYHEQPHDEENVPQWISESDNKVESPLSTTKQSKLVFDEDDNGIVEPPFFKHKYVQPNDYIFFEDHSYTGDKKLPYYLGYNKKMGEFIVIAHSLILPHQLINEYNHHNDFDLHHKRLHKENVLKSYQNLNSPEQYGTDIPLDDDVSSRLYSKEPKVRNINNQYNSKKSGKLIEDTGRDIPEFSGTDIILDDDVSGRSSVAISSEEKSDVENNIDSNNNNIEKKLLNNISNHIALNDDVAARSFTKEAPLYPQDGRYGIYPGQITGKENYNQKSLQNAVYAVNHPNYYSQNFDNYQNTNKKQKEQQLVQEYIEMWPNSGITYAAPAVTNQQYQNADVTSTSERSHLVKDSATVGGENVYEYARIPNKYETNLGSSDQWAPAYYNTYNKDTATAPQHYSEPAYSDSTSELPNFIVSRSDSKELQNNHKNNHRQYKGDNREGNSRYTQGIQKARRYQPGLEKYARIGHEYGGFDGNHGYGDVYSANDHGKIGYGHSGYGHDDHHKGYDDHHKGYDDHHKGYGHGGGYGHDDHGHGGHGGGYGHDDHDEGYGHSSHGHSSSYGKPVKTKKWEKGYNSKGYGKWGQTGKSGKEHHHNKKGHWKEDHQDHHKSKGSKIKTYSYGGKGWYKEESNGQEKGFGGKKGYHQHYDWGHDKSKSQDKKKPYHEYNTKLDGWHKEHGYHK